MAKIGRNQPCPCGSGKKYFLPWRRTFICIRFGCKHPVHDPLVAVGTKPAWLVFDISGRLGDCQQKRQFRSLR
ncbi:MAG: SEC-C domain-containing protein [Desulfobacterales bacterium]|nr:SEC-C domain-containing protein [Desulfobacterales bacterium]